VPPWNGQSPARRGPHFRTDPPVQATQSAPAASTPAIPEPPGARREAGFPAPFSIPPAADEPNAEDDDDLGGLTPPPEYVAAREAALQAARAARGERPPSEDTAPDAVAASDDRSPEDIARSYQDSMAALADLDDPGGITSEEYAPIPAFDAPVAPEPVAPRKLPRGRQSRNRKRPSGPLPGFTGEKVSISPNPMRIAVGLVAGAVGAVMYLLYLPAHAPGGDGDIWRFTDDLYLRAQIVAGAFAGVGLLFILNGLLFRPLREVPCRRCGRWVLAEADGLFLNCPRGRHAAGKSGTIILMTVLLVLCAAAMIHTIAMGTIVRG
jgi:hypothetical protein